MMRKCYFIIADPSEKAVELTNNTFSTRSSHCFYQSKVYTSWTETISVPLPTSSSILVAAGLFSCWIAFCRFAISNVEAWAT
jgi:hypothetical protein